MKLTKENLEEYHDENGLGPKEVVQKNPHRNTCRSTSRSDFLLSSSHLCSVRSVHDRHGTLQRQQECTNLGERQQQANRPSFAMPNSQSTRFHVEETYGEGNWRIIFHGFLEDSKLQHFLIGLLILDVLILFTELYLAAEFPLCNVIRRDGISCCPTQPYDDAHSSYAGAYDGYADDSHDNSLKEYYHQNDDRLLQQAHRWLGGGGGDICEEGYVNMDYDAGCDGHKHEDVHKAEFVLFIMSMSILATFLVELFGVMICLGPCFFFRQPFYALDFFVVAASFILEMTFKLGGSDGLASVAGLLVLARLWRFVRIGHGIIATTMEMASKKHNNLLAYVQQLEELCEMNHVHIPDREDHIVTGLKGLNHEEVSKRLTRNTSDRTTSRGGMDDPIIITAAISRGATACTEHSTPEESESDDDVGSQQERRENNDDL